MVRFALLALFALLGLTQAYPNGAPTLAMPDMMSNLCTTGSLRPNHKNQNSQIMPQSGNAPFTLRVENANVPYRSGSRLRVTLTAEPGKTFKGFFISGDAEDAKAGFEGTWSAAPGTAAKLTRYCVQGMTHTDRTPKTTATVIWSPPGNYTHGTVQFKATVVESFDRFYTNVLSNPVLADSTQDKQSNHAQKQMQQMMANSGGGQGGMFGGLNLQEMMNNMRSQMGQQNMGQNLGQSMGRNFGAGGFNFQG